MQALSALIVNRKHCTDGTDDRPRQSIWPMCFDDTALIAQRLCKYRCITRLDHYEWDNGAVPVPIETQNIPVAAITVELYPTSMKDPLNVQVTQNTNLSIEWDELMFCSDGCAVKDVS